MNFFGEYFFVPTYKSLVPVDSFSFYFELFWGKKLVLSSRLLRLRKVFTSNFRMIIIRIRLFLTPSVPRFFRYRKYQGGGIQPPPFDSSENWYVEYFICTTATIKSN